MKSMFDVGERSNKILDNNRKGRIERYLLNADRFLFDLAPGNQKENYRWLESYDFHFTKASYGSVTRQLLKNYGLDEILTKLLVPAVRKRFPPETIDALRKSWNLGEVPFLESLNQLKVKGKGFAGPDQAFFWRPFVEINFQVHYVEGWGRFAGIWFEEIEPWIKQKESEVEA